jgi:Holliday junction resolvase
MKLRPTARGNSRTIFDIIEVDGPMSLTVLYKKLKQRKLPMTKVQIDNCLKNMRSRDWIEFNFKESQKIDIRSKVLKQQRTLQRNIDQRAMERFIDGYDKVEIKPIKFTPSGVEVKTPETAELRAVTDQKTDFVLIDESIKKLKGVKYSEMEALTVPLPIQVAVMISVTAIITAVSTAIAMRMF